MLPKQTMIAIVKPLIRAQEITSILEYTNISIGLSLVLYSYGSLLFPGQSTYLPVQLSYL